MNIPVLPHNLHALAVCATSSALTLIASRPLKAPPFHQPIEAVVGLLLQPADRAPRTLLHDYVAACLSECPQAPLPERLRTLLHRLLTDEDRYPKPCDMYQGAFLVLKGQGDDGEATMHANGVPESWIRAYRVAAHECLLETADDRSQASAMARRKATGD